MKRNKKILITLGGIVLLAGVYFLILKTAPKNAGYFPFLLILLGLDLFLWRSIQKLLKKSPTFIRASFATLYWSPAVILFLSLLATLLCKRYNPSSHAVIYLMGFVFTMYVSKLVPGLVDLISALIRFLIRIISRIFRLGDVNTEVINRGFRPVHLAGYGTGLAMLVLLVLGMAWWGYDFRIVEHNLSIPDLPEAFRGCRIVQISDLHLGTWPSKSKLEEVVSDVNELSPDLIL
ncbi:MAG: hypothetical protein PHD61_08850, partial [Bacteroidales bacterium]|nr:hypothetical protein [Bacteroidales bacterium]